MRIVTGDARERPALPKTSASCKRNSFKTGKPVLSLRIVFPRILVVMMARTAELIDSFGRTAFEILRFQVKTLSFAGKNAG